MIPSGGGRFEVVAGEQLIFSKKGLGRHAQLGEIARLLQEQASFKLMPLEA